MQSKGIIKWLAVLFALACIFQLSFTFVTRKVEADAAKQENPNAYEPWTEEADSELTELWSNGMAVAEIADYFGRKNTAIITRLKRLGL